MIDEKGHPEMTPATLKRAPMTGAERQRKHTAQHSQVLLVPPKNPKRRKTLESDDAAWLKYYGQRTFTREFDPPHLESIAMLRWVAETSRSAAIAGERGLGKSAPIVWLVLKFALTGEFKFPVYVPWASGHSAGAMLVWRFALTQNERLAEDYPEMCAPFVHAGGVSQRMPALRWAHSDEPCGAALNMGRGIIVFPDNKGALGTKSINGQPRGMFYPSSDGAWVRPDFAAIDDVQDRKVAKSDQLVADVRDRIDQDVGGMGDAGAPLPMFITGNCITDHCVMTTYLADARYKSIRIGCIAEWPDGWDADGVRGKVRKLWREWWSLIDVGEFKEAGAHYTKNKKAMTTGMQISSPNAYGDPAKIEKTGVSDCLTLAMFQYFKMGHSAFMAERQQQPESPMDVAELRISPAIIKKRNIGPERGEAPEGTVRIVAGADINPGIHSRLGARVTWAVGAFDMHQSCAVIAYGIHAINMPEDPTASQQVAAVYAALNEVRQGIASMGVTALIYDARGWYNKGVTRGQALRYARAPLPGCSVPAIGAEGWPHDKYRPKNKTAIRAFESGHVAQDTIEQVKCEWVAFDSDWFHLQVLRGWLAPPGAPGACVVHAGDVQAEFAIQTTRRAYAGTVEKFSGTIFDWIRQPGEDDYDDAIAMCYVGASWAGITTDGIEATQRKRKPRKRKVRNVKI